jgi:hypothetical protein
MMFCACFQSGGTRAAVQFCTNLLHKVDLWHTLSVVVDGGRMKTFVNGVLQEALAMGGRVIKCPPASARAQIYIQS